MQQTIAKVSWIQKIRRISAGIVWWATTLRIADSVCSKTLFFLCQRCAAFEMDVWRHGLRIGPAHYVETIWWIGKRQTAVHVAVRNPRLFRLVLVHERMALLLRTLGSAGRKPFLINPRGTLSIRDAGDMTGRVSLSTKMWIVNSMVIPTNIPHSSSPIQLCIFEDDAAAVHMIIRGRSPHLREATGPCSVDFHKLIQRIYWGSHHFHQACADDGSGGRYVDTG